MQVKDGEPGCGDMGVYNTSTQKAEAEGCRFEDSLGCL